MSKIGLKGKLVLSLLLAGILPMLVMSIYSYQKSSSSLQEASFETLMAVRDTKGAAVRRYFEGIKDQALTYSHNTMIVDAMKQFRKAFNTFEDENEISEADRIVFKEKLTDFYANEFGKKYSVENGHNINVEGLLNQLSDKEMAFQYHYIANNIHPLGEKEGLNFAADSSTYSQLHKKYHPPIREFLQKFGYYDIFLVDIDSGHIVYSVFKELDYATSLATGPYSSTGFAEAFDRAKKLTDTESTILVDYKKYPPSYEAPASFMASPIWDNGKKIGVLIFQMPIDRLNTIMGERAGMGKTGETYLFGMDKLMRSDSHLDQKNFNVVSSFKESQKGTLSGETVENVLKGESGNRAVKNYLGDKVLSAYTPIDILGLKWGLVAEIHSKEAFANTTSLQFALFFFVLITAMVISAMAYLMGNSIASKITNVAKKLLDNSDEVADSSDRIFVSSNELSEASVLQASSLQETVASIDEISSMVERNADAAGNSTEVSDKSTIAASTGKENVQTMISSINEISHSYTEIMDEMHHNNTEFSKIVTVISEIGEKTKVINDIVFQTKLLSFNASVEAARAGEHGKGFAVVAEEVGNLAAMSGKAALEITEMLDTSIRQVSEIVDNSKEKIEALVSSGKTKVEAGTKTASNCGESLDEILKNVSTVNEMVREIASASAEQSTGVNEITKAMQQLDQTTHKNTTVAQQSSSMANTLKGQADSLHGAVDELLALVGGKIKNGVLSGGSAKIVNATSTSDVTKVSNIVNLNEHHHKRKESTANEVRGVKVAGSDTMTPLENDPRFEDL